MTEINKTKALNIILANIEKRQAFIKGARSKARKIKRRLGKLERGIRANITD